MFCVYVPMHIHKLHVTYVSVREQLPCGVQGFNSGRQIWWQAPLLTEPYCLPSGFSIDHSNQQSYSSHFVLHCKDILGILGSVASVYILSYMGCAYLRLYGSFNVIALKQLLNLKRILKVTILSLILGT